MKRNSLYFFLLIFAIFTVNAQSYVSPSISALRATLKTCSTTTATIELTWDIPAKNDITEFKIYRDTKQITKDSLSSLTPIIILTGPYTRYTDSVTDLSAACFYCVTTKNFQNEEFNVIIPMVNSTVNAIVPSPKVDVLSELKNNRGHVETAENERSLIPLPYLNELEKANKDKIDISENDLEIARKFALQNPEKKTKQIQILDADKTPDSGDQFFLSQIVNSSFKNGQWDIAMIDFSKFLKNNRTQETVDRANFYLGQIYYYKGDSKNAIYCFMKSQDKYPVESRQWIDEVLNSIEN